MSGPGNGGLSSAYRALRESEELHRATLSNISDAVFLSDDEGTLTWVCPNVDVIFGYVPDEVHAMGRIGRLLGDDLFELPELAQRGEICNLEREVTAKSGAARTVLIHVKRVAISGGTVLYTCRDVTALKRAEKELATMRMEMAQAARLALVGELMASIVHEVQQPLTSIRANAAAGIRLAPAGELREIFDDIHIESSAAAEIVDRLRNMVRRRPLDMQTLDANEIVTEVLQLVAPDARRRQILLRAELGSSLPKIAADRVGMQQVLLNLLVNAMDAVDSYAPSRRQVRLRTHPVDGSVEISVSDTGCGLPQEQRSRLFDAFFTTKSEGVGLGLAIARSIVEAHSGRIEAEDHPDGGAIFRVALPGLAQQR